MDLGTSAEATGSQLVCRESRNRSFKSGHELWQTELVRGLTTISMVAECHFCSCLCACKI